MPSRCSTSASIRTPAFEVSRRRTRPAPLCRRSPANRTGPRHPPPRRSPAPRPCRCRLGRDRLRPSGRARPIGGTGVDVGDWLRGLGLERYEQALRDNDIDADILPELTGDDLTGLGINSIGHRRKLLAAIAALRPAPTTPSVTPLPATEAAPGVPSDAFPSGAERRQLTVMFVDLVGSTTLAARLDPEEM